jgi:hypothetical protein
MFDQCRSDFFSSFCCSIDFSDVARNAVLVGWCVPEFFIGIFLESGEPSTRMVAPNEAGARDCGSWMSPTNELEYYPQTSHPMKQ